MVQLTRRPTLACFRGMFLVVNSKNTKLAYQCPTFQEARQCFLDDIDMHMDVDKLNTRQTWIDIGREVAPNASQPTTFLWRMCCLDKWRRSLCANDKAHSMQYRCQLLENVGSMTVELKGENPLRKGGIVYAQRYNTSNRLFDAQGKRGLTSKAIEGFLVPKHLGELWRTAGGGSGTWTTSICKEIYLTSKNRVQHALDDAALYSFSTREEYRIRWDLFCELEPSPALNTRTSRRVCCSYWRLSTQEVLKFMRWELNRWLGCLEWLHGQQWAKQLTHDRIVMGTILARLARASINNEAVHIDYNMWKDSWTTQSGLYREGLDMESSMRKYGLVWLPARKFNWQYLYPEEEFKDNCTFQYNTLRTAYQRRRESVAEVDGIYRDVQVIARSLEDADPLQTRERLNWLHRLCYREFAKRILEHCKSEHRTDEEIPSTALTGDSSITWDHMVFVLGKVPHLHKPYKNKKLDKTWAQHIQYFFEWDDGLPRPGWEKQQYRLLTQHAFNCIQQAVGVDEATEWRQSIGLKGCRHFSLLPHSGISGFQIRKEVGKKNQKRQERGMLPLHNRQWLGAFHMSHEEGSKIDWLPENQELWIVGTRKIMRGPRDPIEITPIIDTFLAARE
jgi:hypothetical protein